MLANHYILYGANPDSRNTKYSMVYTKPGIYKVRGVGTPYVYIQTRRRYSGLLHGVHTGNLYPDEGKIANMGGKRVNITV